jgi:outer membrane protein OmpA-like peptidoglycan-associated protein
MPLARGHGPLHEAEVTKIGTDMRYRLATLLLLFIGLAGCANPFGEHTRRYSIYFQPYSSELDDHARADITDAASFAHGHPLQPISVAGYSAPPDPSKDVDGLSAARAEAVKQALVTDGVGAGRISVEANGITDPEGKPNLAVRRVDINIGK